MCGLTEPSQSPASTCVPPSSRLASISMDLCSCLPPGSSDINFASCQTWKAPSRLSSLKSCSEHPRPDSGLLKEAQGRRLPLRLAPTSPPCRCLQVDPEALWQPRRSKAVCRVLQAAVDIIFSLQQKSRLQELCLFSVISSQWLHPEGLRLEVPLESITVRSAGAAPHPSWFPVSPRMETPHPLWAT